MERNFVTLPSELLQAVPLPLRQHLQRPYVSIEGSDPNLHVVITGTVASYTQKASVFQAFVKVCERQGISHCYNEIAVEPTK